MRYPETNSSRETENLHDRPMRSIQSQQIGEGIDPGSYVRPPNVVANRIRRLPPAPEIEARLRIADFRSDQAPENIGLATARSARTCSPQRFQRKIGLLTVRPGNGK